MKKAFKVFNQDKSLSLNHFSSSSLVVLDSSVLLNTIRYSKESREKIFEAIAKVQDNLFIPYIIGLEYYFNRQAVLKSISASKVQVENEVDKLSEHFRSEIFASLDKFSDNIKSSDEIKVREDIKRNFNQKLDFLTEEFKKNQLRKEFDLLGGASDDSERLAELLDDKVTDGLTQN